MAIYRVKEGNSKLARDLMDPLRKLRDNFSDIEATHEKMIQAQNSIAGTLSTRTSDTAGSATLSAGHGATSGSLANVLWAGGARTGVVVGSASGNVVPFTGGEGNVLPAQNTAVTVVHYATLAAEMKIVDAAGNDSPAAAYGLFNEVASMLASAAASLKQCAARLVNFNS